MDSSSRNSSEYDYDNACIELNSATLKYYRDLVNDFRECFYQIESDPFNGMIEIYGHRLNKNALASLGKEINIEKYIDTDQYHERIGKVPQIGGDVMKWVHNAGDKLYRLTQKNSLEMRNGRIMVDLIMETLMKGDNKNIAPVRKFFTCETKENPNKKPLMDILHDHSLKNGLLLDKLDAASKLLSILSDEKMVAQAKVEAFNRELNSAKTQTALLKKRNKTADIFLSTVLTILVPLGLLVGAYRLWGKLINGKDFVISIPSSGAKLDSSAKNIMRKVQKRSEEKISFLSEFEKTNGARKKTSDDKIEIEMITRHQTKKT